MANSRRVNLPANTFVQITQGETLGSIYHLTGGRVVYVQSDAEPADFDVTTPTSASTKNGNLLPFYGLGSSKIYAYAIQGDASITISPGV